MQNTMSWKAEINEMEGTRSKLQEERGRDQQHSGAAGR